MKTYQERIDSVLEYVKTHLKEKLDLDTLANMAFLSKFHFHRIMKSYLGESLGRHVNRLRVQTAARLLKYSDNPVTEIAFMIGYDSPTSFTKGFKKHFGVSPSQFRKHPKHSFETIKTNTYKTDFDFIVQEKIVQRHKVVYVPSRGRVGPNEISEVWEELMLFAVENNILRETTRRFGVHWDDPSITLKQHLRYDACLSIDEETKISGYPVKYIAGGKHLSFLYKGDYQFIGDVYDQIFRDYIIKTKIRLREEPIFNQYLNDKKQILPENLLTEIFIPVI